MSNEKRCEELQEKVQEKLPEGWTAEVAILEEGAQTDHVVIRLRPDEGEAIRCIFNPKMPDEALMSSLAITLEQVIKERIQV